MPADAVTIWTIGHSNRTLEQFLDLLRAQHIELLVDIRRFPGSRKHPHFGPEAFPAGLAQASVEYELERDLGGRRRLDPEAAPEIGGGWRNASFRAYAQYTRSPEFRAALAHVRERARATRLAICCSEAVPWRCHRWLVSDVLTAQHADRVLHVTGPGAPREHRPSSFAQMIDGRVAWPAPEAGVGADVVEQASPSSR